MSDQFTYKTIKGSSEALYRVQGSKHLAYAFPVISVSEAKKQLEQLWTLHPQATHICYAWRIGWDKSECKSSDDGEPSGTAGKPIANQLLSFDLTNTMVAVVRYFGGTKLGTSGLIDAYKTAAKLVLEASVICEQSAKDHIHLSFTHEQLPAVMKHLKELGMQKISSNFGMNCEMEFLLDSRHRQIFKQTMIDLAIPKVTHIKTV